MSISIHAPSRERQSCLINMTPIENNFNPRSLAGATRNFFSFQEFFKFQSTLPRGSDADIIAPVVVPAVISIHAPSRERHI